MFKRKLFKRALPIILSVAMVFQSAPATALAAEDPVVAESAETGESQSDGEAQASQEDDEGQQPGGETQTPPESEEKQSGGETQTVPESSEQQTGETTQLPQESEEEQVDADEEVKKADADEEVQQSDADAAAQIIIDESALRGYVDNYNDGVVSESYDPESNVFDDIVNGVLKGETEVLSVKVGGETNENLKDRLTYQWTNESGNLPAGETPKNAGKYQLVISLEAIDGLCKAAEARIDFEIKQAELHLNIDRVNTSPEVGTTIADFVKDFKDHYVLMTSGDAEVNKDTYVKEIKVVVRDSVSGVEITDAAAKFEKGSVYSYTVSVELNDANYTVRDLGVQDIRPQGDIKTSMEVTLSRNIEYTYGDEVKLPVAGTDYTVKVSYEEKHKDENGTVTSERVEIEAPADSITAKWLDADGNEIESPSDAGTYYVLLTYADAEGRYTACDNGVRNGDKITSTSIKVVINPVSIYIKPSLDKTEYTDGKTAADILQDVKYDLLTSKDNTALTADQFDKATGWGVSYNNTDKTQYYEPVFVLQCAERLLDDDGNPQKGEDGKFVYGEYEDIDNSQKLIGGDEYAYRIVFKGKKAVYNGSGVASDAVDINDGANSAVPNYKVDVSADTLSKNFVGITIAKSGAVIDISQYTDFKDGIRTKVFDYEPLYQERAEYKKATVDGSDKGLTYRWYEAYKNEETGKYEKYGEELNTFQYTYENGVLRNYVSPVEAGTYMLSISYTDPDHEKSAEDAELICIIEPQIVKAEVATGTEGDHVTAYSGTSIEKYAYRLAGSLAKTIKKAEENNENNFTEDPILNLWEYGEEYGLTPFVERQDNVTSEWKTVNMNDTFIEGGHYRIAFGVDINLCDEPIGDLFWRNYQSYKTEEAEDGTEERKYYLSNYVDVTVEKMGTTPLELVADEIGAMTKVYDGTPFAVPADKIKVYNKNTGDLVTGIELEYRWYDETDYEYVSADEAANGGKYTLYASFSGNDVYAPFGNTMVGQKEGFEITKRAISVTPVLMSRIEAGQDTEEPVGIVQSTRDDYDYEHIIYLMDVTGDILDTDALAFDCREWYDREAGEYHYGYKAFEDVNLAVVQADGTEVPNSVLRSEKTYYVVSGVELSTPYDRNYEVTTVKAEFTPVRVGAAVSKTSDTDIDPTSLKDFMGNDTEDSRVITHTIVPREGIPYTLAKNSGIKDDQGKNVGGNLFVFKIRAPKEFFEYGSEEFGTTNFLQPVFEKSVKENGGYLITTETEARENGYIIAAFKTEGEDEQPSFTVRWSDGYLEKFTVDFKGAVLEDDLTKAVAPKSLAFNSPVTKMVIGEKQQLDVKITKSKLDDIICLKYVLEDESSTVLSVSETGAVVALEKGTATVKAVPCYLDEDGVKQPIDGAKAATVKITVNDVTAPKIKAVTASDVSATVTYPKLDDGYRREIYVLKEPANAKEQDFTDAIDALKNGDWKSAGFAIEPVYISVEKYDAKTKLCSVELRGLTANTQYTVYVRNVSGVRKLADGSSVVASAKGSVKSFKTTLSQLHGIRIRFDEEYWVPNPYMSDNFYWFEKGYGAYVVDVTEKKIPSLTAGVFWENADNPDASDEDEIEYTLPLDKEMAKKYAQPKLSYFAVTDCEDYEEQADSYYTLKVGDRYYHPSSIAKVDNKGNVTLTGTGWVDICVYDAVSAQTYESGRLFIDAAATKMTVAKKANVRVGEPLYLTDYVTYFADKQKLTSYWSNLRITKIDDADVAEYDFDNSAFTFARSENDPVGSVSCIIANEPKQSITLEVTDISMKEDNVGTITITSKDIEAVKNLKVTEVVDKYATVSFTYPASVFEYRDNPDTAESANQLYFRIQIRDAAKNVVSDNYYHSKYWDDDEYEYRYEDGKEVDKAEYDAKKKVYTFTKYIGLDKPLNRKSSYTVSVTATYLKNEVTSKPASKGFKTTDIPAAYQWEYDGSFYPYNTKADSAYKLADGGIGIYVGNNVSLGSYPALTSNNTYTLVARPDNYEAKNRLSDTLTWKSTDTKVATVKANAGSYTATLKTVKKGTTKIELTSKVTKKLIARWTVFVNAAGEASYYYGDWEPDEGQELVDGYEYGDIELLTLDNPVKAALQSGEGKIAKFVAPEYGSYNFSVGGTVSYWIGTPDPDVDGDIKWSNQGNGGMSNVALRKGEIRYIRTVNTYSKPTNVTISVTGTMYDVWSGVGEYTLDKSGTIAFTAPEDNYYIVKNSAGQVSRTFGAMKAGDTKTAYFQAGTYTITKREISGTFDEKGLTKQSIAGKTTQWYVFKPTYDMDFTLGLSGEGLSIAVYENIMSASSQYGTEVSLKAGETRYIAVTNESSKAVETDITVKAKAERGTVGEVASVALKTADEGVYVRFSIPEDGCYRLNVKATKSDADGKPVAADFTAEQVESADVQYGLSIDPTAEQYFEKGKIIYVYVESSDASEEDKVVVTATINVTKIEAKDLAEDGAKDQKFNGNDYSYYKFTARTDGEYTFKAEIAKRTEENAATPNVSVNYYTGKDFNVDSYWRGYGADCTVTLKNGGIVYLRVKTDDTENKEDTGTITVSRLEATSFTDEWKGSLKDGETKWLQFKASKDTIYNITCKDGAKEDGTGAVTVETADRLSINASTGSLSNASNKYYKAGETIYLKLYAGNGAATCTVTATAVTPTKAPAKDVTVKAGATQWFEYTANRDAKYKVAFSGEGTAFVTVRKYTSLNGSGSQMPLTSEMNIKAGETVYFTAQNDTEKDQVVTLEIAPVSYDQLTTSKTVKVKMDQSVWYSFTAEKAGRYSFTAEAKAAEGQTASANISYYTDMLGEKSIKGVASNPENAVFVKANETIYLCVEVSGADADVTTSVKQIQAEDITAKAGTLAEKTQSNLAQNSYQWYEIKGEGTYTIDISDATGAYSAWGVTNNGSYGTISMPRTITLSSADTYTIAVRADADKLGYKLTSTKRDVKDLTLAAPVSGSLKTGENLYVSFKAPEAGRYAVRIEGLADGVASTIAINGGESVINNNNYCTFVAQEINDKITFTINVTSEESASFNVRAEVVSPADITENGTATVDVAKTPAGYISWYSYTAKENGKYLVKTSGKDIKVYSSNGSQPQLTDSFNGTTTNPREVSLKEGVTYYYGLEYSGKQDANVTLSVAKVTANPLEKEYEVDVTKLLPNEKIYLSFTAPADNRYVFACSDPTVSAYTYANVDAASWNGTLTFGEEKPMKAGEKLVFAVSASAVPEKNFKISVNSITIETLEASSADAPKPVKKTIASDEALWVSFKAGATAMYQFDMTNVSEAYVYKELTTDKYDPVNGSYGVDKDQTVYLKLFPDSAQADESGKVEVSITATADIEMTSMTADAPNEVKDIAAGAEKWVYFTAEKAGIYRFTVSGGCAVWKYNDLNAASNENVADGGSCTQQLGIGDSVYFKLNNNTSDAVTETITVEVATQVGELMTDVPASVDDIKDGYDAYYVFTAPEAGTYSITAANDSNQTARIEVCENFKNNDWGSDKWGTYTLELEKGDVRYIRIYASDSNCTVTCSKVAEQTLTTGKEQTKTLQSGQSVLFQWTADKAGYYKIQYTAGADVNWEYAGYSGSSSANVWPVQVQSGDEITLCLRARTDSTKVTVSVEELKVVECSGEMFSNQIARLNAGQAALVEWTADATGNYCFEMSSDGFADYRYYLNSLSVWPYSYNSTYERQTTAGDRIYILIQSRSKGNTVSLSVSTKPVTLSKDSTSYVELGTGDSQEFTFTATEHGKYIFCSTYTSSKLQATNIYPNTSYSERSVTDDNFCFVRELYAGQTATFTVQNIGDYQTSAGIAAYMMAGEPTYVQLDSYGGNWSVTTGSRQEKWFQFTVTESGTYQISSNNGSVYMKLYADNTNGDLLGSTDPWGNSNIQEWLDEGTTVLLRTWYNDHDAADYSITVSQVAIQDNDMGSQQISSNSGSRYANASDNYQAVLHYTYENTDASSVTLTFSNAGGLNMALYLDDELVLESDNGELEYQVGSDYFNSIKLVVWKDQYQSFSAQISHSIKGVEYEDITDVSINGEQSVYVPQQGERVVTYAPISEAGKYVFYSTDSIGVTLFNNDEVATGDEVSNGFQYTLDLSVQDVVKLVFRNDTDNDCTIQLSGYQVTEVSETGQIEGNTTPITVSTDGHAIKTTTYTVSKAGKYTFTPSATESNTDYRFELTVGETTYTEWDTATDQVELKENDEVTFTLWNANHYQSASAEITVAYTAAETETNPDQSGGGDGEGSTTEPQA